MYKYAKEFKKECIPHISEQHEIVDTIHNYPRQPKEKSKEKDDKDMAFDFTEKRKNSGFEHGRPTLKEDDINSAKKEL
jgi:hypothetical protein